MVGPASFSTFPMAGPLVRRRHLGAGEGREAASIFLRGEFRRQLRRRPPLSGAYIFNGRATKLEKKIVENLQIL